MPVVTPAVAVTQSSLTLVAEFDAAALPSVKATLERLGDDPQADGAIPFGELRGVHFARLLLLEPATDLDGEPLAGKIVMLTDVDGELGDHLQDLLDVAGEGLDAVFGACAGYPRGKRAPTRARREAWLREHVVDAGTSYVNTIGRTVEQVRREAELHRRINAFLDAGDWQGHSAAEVRAAIQDHVNSQHDLTWAMAEPSGARAAGQLERLADLASVPLAVAALTPLLLPALPLWFAALLVQELRDPAPHLRPDPEHVAELAELEDHVVQNQFTAIGYRKPGPVRWLAARGILPLLDYGTRNLFGRGNLTGVRTIHFARWVLLDDDKRLLFASNYDGSLESYMDDFIDKVAWGLNLVFSNGVGYPRTHALIFGGARREQEFKDYLRRHQLPTQVWYSAYPDLTAVNIENNARIRSGLVGPLDDAACERWLARL